MRANCGWPFIIQMKEIFAGFGVVLLVVALIFGLSYGGFAMYAFFAPKYTAVDNAVFHESQQYTDGMVNQLEHYCEGYKLATTRDAKESISSIVRHEYATFPESKLNPDLQNCLEKMKEGV